MAERQKRFLVCAITWLALIVAALYGEFSGILATMPCRPVNLFGILAGGLIWGFVAGNWVRSGKTADHT